jgi:acetyltransferase-like isoleucine patch superfamily enzyme
MRAILTAQSLEWLQDHRIFTHPRCKMRLKAGQALDFRADTEIEPHVGFYAGNAVCPMGVMSFSNSVVYPRIRIGRYCSIGHGVETKFGNHPIEHVSTSILTPSPSYQLPLAFMQDHGVEPVPGVAIPQRPPPVIGHDVWIGAHASILPGVAIGTGAVVAANSVVTRNVGPYEIVAGNPARLLRKRFGDEVIAGLLESEWWQYRFTDFRDLSLDDPATFLTQFQARKVDLEPYRPVAARMVDMPQEARGAEVAATPRLKLVAD